MLGDLGEGASPKFKQRWENLTPCRSRPQRLKIWSFHVVFVQGRQRNVQKKRDTRAKLLFYQLNPLLFDVAVAVAIVLS